MEEQDKALAAGADGDGAAGAGPKAGPSQEQMAKAEGVAEAIKAARSKPVSSAKQKFIQEAMDKAEANSLKTALGMDLPFDVMGLLTKGVVEQVGMKISDDMYVDMHTLTKAEDILAERLVEEINGPMPISKAYVEAKLVATLAIAITRINRERFPVPDVDPAMRKTDDWRADWDLKKALAKALMVMSPNDIDALGLIYANLDKMDVLVVEEARKKST